MKLKAFVIILALFVTGCAATPIQREMQVAKGIRTTQVATVDALNYNIISAEDGGKIQAGLRVAITSLKKAITARRAGATPTAYDIIMAASLDALLSAQAYLE